jgi:hypothetical protein
MNMQLKMKDCKIGPGKEGEREGEWREQRRVNTVYLFYILI